MESPTKRLKFGVQIEPAMSGSEWRAIARQVEQLGFNTLFVPDHITTIFAPWTALATAAAVTETLRVGPLLLNNDLRHPVIVAHEAATLDVLSSGRLELGIGAGWNRIEYDESGLPFDRPGVRVDRLAESATILARLFSGESVEFDGRHYGVRAHTLVPAPVQQPRLPLMIGGNGDRVLSLAGRLADAVNFLGRTVRPDGTRDNSAYAPNELRRKIDLIRCSAGERFPSIELSPYVSHFQVGANAEAAAATVERDSDISLEDFVQSPFSLFGTPQDMADKIIRVRKEFGFNYWIVNGRAREEMAMVIRELTGR